MERKRMVWCHWKPYYWYLFYWRESKWWRYPAFLLNILPLILEDIPLRNRMRMWYQHDGCPLHNEIVARNVLNRVHPGSWIGRGGPRTWPVLFPDLTPLDLLMGNTKGHCVPGCSNNTGKYAATYYWWVCCHESTSNWTIKAVIIQRLQFCINVIGQHFERLLLAQNSKLFIQVDISNTYLTSVAFY
jgi:hypothetical protein